MLLGPLKSDTIYASKGGHVKFRLAASAATNKWSDLPPCNLTTSPTRIGEVAINSSRPRSLIWCHQIEWKLTVSSSLARRDVIDSSITATRAEGWRCLVIWGTKSL